MKINSKTFSKDLIKYVEDRKSRIRYSVNFSKLKKLKYSQN